jgi:hypothetical protein
LARNCSLPRAEVLRHFRPRPSPRHGSKTGAGKGSALGASLLRSPPTGRRPRPGCPEAFCYRADENHATFQRKNIPNDLVDPLVLDRVSPARAFDVGLRAAGPPWTESERRRTFDHGAFLPPEGSVHRILGCVQQGRPDRERFRRQCVAAVNRTSPADGSTALHRTRRDPGRRGWSTAPRFFRHARTCHGHVARVWGRHWQNAGGTQTTPGAKRQRGILPYATGAYASKTSRKRDTTKARHNESAKPKAGTSRPRTSCRRFA